MFGSNSFIRGKFLPQIENLRKKIFAILVSERNSNPTARLFNYIIISLIFINVAAIILETVKSIYKNYFVYFEILEIYTLTIFSIEYFLQLWVCTLRPKYSHPFWGRLKFMISPMAIVELLVIMPFLIFLITRFSADQYDLRFLTIFRFVMVLRIFKLEKYADAMETFKHVLSDKKEELILTFFTIIMLLILTSCTMYFIEHDVNKDFESIPETMWWATSTLTTVGYGDVVPITPLGKFLGSIIAMLGIAMFAVPAGLISSSFTEYVQLRKNKKSCPHCGKELN